MLCKLFHSFDNEIDNVVCIVVFFQVADEGVLIKTLYSGVCHSDVHFIDDEVDLGQDRVFKYSDVLGQSCITEITV